MRNIIILGCVMGFRYDEAAAASLKDAEKCLISPKKIVSTEDRKKSLDVLLDIVEKYGSPVTSYPDWHPLVFHHDSNLHGKYLNQCGYDVQDHYYVQYFVNAFIVCLYTEDHAEELINSVCNLKSIYAATIEAKKLDCKFYSDSLHPVLVYCEWNDGLLRHRSISGGNTIPMNVAIPLMLEKEVPTWRCALRGETWETMRPHFLGLPQGKLSSLFVSQKTGLMMKKVWNLLVNTGMFGDVKTGEFF